jgi:hypothetical protein
MARCFESATSRGVRWITASSGLGGLSYLNTPLVIARRQTKRERLHGRGNNLPQRLSSRGAKRRSDQGREFDRLSLRVPLWRGAGNPSQILAGLPRRPEGASRNDRFEKAGQRRGQRRRSTYRWLPLPCKRSGLVCRVAMPDSEAKRHSADSSLRSDPASSCRHVSRQRLRPDDSVRRQHVPAQSPVTHVFAAT